jgi:2-keto-3-deoxy-L-rhamnonate aldolase RhmA
MAATAGYDVSWIDLEHSTISLDAAAGLAMTARDLGIAAWIRIEEGAYGAAGRLLDGGAAGIIVPHVVDAAGARAAVAACRYPPRGERSQNTMLPQFGFARMRAGEKLRRAEESTVVQVLIESPAAVDNINDIAGVEGVDLIGIGLNDLSAACGRPGNVRDAEVMSLCCRVIEGARHHDVPVVVGGVADVGHFAELTAMGAAPLVFAGIDTELLGEALATRIERWRGGVEAAR